MTQVGKGRVLVEGVKGKRPPTTTKIGIRAKGAWQAEFHYTLFGLDLEQKAEWTDRQVNQLLDTEYNGKGVDRFDIPGIKAGHFLLHDRLDRSYNASSTYDGRIRYNKSTQQAFFSSAATMASKTFAVPELAEAILLNLPRGDMFVLRRVSLLFKQTIEGSPRLMRAMFLEYMLDDDSIPTTVNPLLSSIVAKAGFQLGPRYWIAATNTYRIVLYNHSGFRSVEEKGLQKYASWGASWRKTWVTSREVAVEIHYMQGGSYNRYKQDKLYDLDGWVPTLGQLFDMSWLIRGHYERWAKLSGGDMSYGRIQAPFWLKE
ncbi:hypothetical protein LTR36_006680 [Oleoguttula mirabilis]|uniref:Acyclic terpene utilisation N-terminal domain-containing protein n=1 Tax=Oleoguttula mirabilis TaxID=1507867 RepID=A0AAV9JC23_9PEZI|nr:hypothetical protein LTR36_006680 [Oleoguttula mirabilis]